MPPVIDIMLLTDATGSMATAIDDVKANMEHIWRKTQSQSRYSIQVGVAWYRDIVDLGPDGTISPYGIAAKISSDPEEVCGAIAGLQAKGGGDAPEAQLYALYHLANDTLAVGWRPGAMRYIAWFGDKPGHDPVIYPAGHETSLADTTAALLDRNIIVTAFSMNPSDHLDSTGQAIHITEATTGVFCPGVDQAGVVETIFETIGSHVP